MAAATQTLAFTIQVKDKDAEEIISSGALEGDKAAVLKQYAESLLTDFAHGGMMLDPATVRKLESALGDLTVEKLLHAVDQACSMKQGRTVISWDLDPSRLSHLKQVAEIRGLTLNRMVQEWMEYVLDQGTMTSKLPDMLKIRLNDDDYHFLSGMIGIETFHGHDIVEWIKARVAEDLSPRS